MHVCTYNASLKRLPQVSCKVFNFAGFSCRRVVYGHFKEDHLSADSPQQTTKTTGVLPSQDVFPERFTNSKFNSIQFDLLLFQGKFSGGFFGY